MQPCELQQQQEECQAQSEDEEFVSLKSHSSLNQVSIRKFNSLFCESMCFICDFFVTGQLN